MAEMKSACRRGDVYSSRIEGVFVFAIFYIRKGAVSVRNDQEYVHGQATGPGAKYISPGLLNPVLEL